MAVLNRERGLNATVLQATLGCTNLKGIVVTNSSAATCFVQLFNALVAGVSLGTTLADLQVEVGAGLTVSLPMPPEGAIFGTGIAIASTTTDNGLTGSGATVTAYLMV
jgi:hypothetical protein